MNLEQIKADSEAARHQEWDWLCESDGFDLEHYAHIANCDPQTILKLLAVVEAVRNTVAFHENFGYAEIYEISEALAALGVP